MSQYQLNYMLSDSDRVIRVLWSNLPFKLNGMRYVTTRIRFGLVLLEVTARFGKKR